nr:MAG TPA: hypothetical protein [Caudoviricetes sp.]
MQVGGILACKIFLPFLGVKTADRRRDGAAGAGRLKSV